MRYLKQFIDFLASGPQQDETDFSQSVKQALLKTKNDFEKDGISFDIEPIEVKEVKEENNHYYIHHYTGAFIYGFRKNSTFHEIPGDVSTETERKQNETGEIAFYVNKKTNKVDMIHETFAGNKWGEKEQMKRKFGLWGAIGILVLVLIIGWNLFDDIKPRISSFVAEWSLREYKDDIAKCVTEKKVKLGNEKVFGLEYECAIEVAATFYNSNPEKAIQLCLINNPLFEIQLGQKYSSFDTDDLSAQNNEQMARVSCESSIKKILDGDKATSEAQNKLANLNLPAKSTVIETNPETTVTEAESFYNEKYGYILSLLSTDVIGSNQYATEANQSNNVYIRDKNQNLLIKIEVLDPNRYGNSAVEQEIKKVISLPLSDYVKHISDLNKDNIDVDMLESYPIGGISGYTISILDSFTNDSGGHAFGDDYPVHAFIFIEHNGMKYQFEIPESLGHRGGKILNSIQFE